MESLIHMLIPCLADYETIGLKHDRIFLLTTPEFNIPFLEARSRLAQEYLEKVAGPFDNFVTSSPVSISATA